MSRWNSSRFAHLTSLILLTRYESRHAKRLTANSADLHRFERSIHSQHGEDGIIAEILRRIGSGQRVLIEIGAADGAENCTAELVSQGWSGVWIEGDSEKVAAARERTEGRSVRVVEAYVDRESIPSLLEEQSLPTEPDLLVIDVDGNDYWIWKSISTRYAPRVVVIEYNAAIGPHLQWAMPYNRDHRWNETAWHGASLAALVRLGQRMGYALVGCDSQGVNAFFVRRKYARYFAPSSIQEHWVPPRYMLPYGHRVRDFNEFDSQALPPDSGRDISMRARALERWPLRSGQIFYLDVEVKNRTSFVVGSSRNLPLQLTYWWLATDGSRVGDEIERCSQIWRCDPRRTYHLLCRAQAPEAAGTYSLVLCLVQENVRWLEEGKLGVGSWTVVGS